MSNYQTVATPNDCVIPASGYSEPNYTVNNLCGTPAANCTAGSYMTYAVQSMPYSGY